MSFLEGLEISAGVIAAIVVLAILVVFAMFVRGMRDMPEE